MVLVGELAVPNHGGDLSAPYLHLLHRVLCAAKTLYAVTEFWRARHTIVLVEFSLEYLLYCTVSKLNQIGWKSNEQFSWRCLELFHVVADKATV